MNTVCKLFFALVTISSIALSNKDSSCATVRNLTEKMICESADLSALQLKLDASFKQLFKNADTAQIERLKREHSKWREKRDQCKTKDCLHSEIMNRITAIDKSLKQQN